MFLFVRKYLDELAPLVLLHVQIKPLRLNLEHLRRKLLILLLLNPIAIIAKSCSNKC